MNTNSSLLSGEENFLSKRKLLLTDFQDFLFYTGMKY